jgi:hypothetical protein
MHEMESTHALVNTFLLVSCNRPLTKPEILAHNAMLDHINMFHRAMEVVRSRNLENLRKLDERGEPSGGGPQQSTES